MAPDRRHADRRKHRIAVAALNGDARMIGTPGGPGVSGMVMVRRFARITVVFVIAVVVMRRHR